ncbi:MAG TPA: hypothetical protein VF069_17175 [Streptosporangiaceae bacterium]
MPRVKRVPKRSTVQFIAMLRALDRAVASYGVSHAQVERRLCDWLTEGRRAEAALRDWSQDADRERLRALANRKTAVELSGLARLDGRRDRAGGQRIGELVAGRFPRGSMPSRRRADVCVDVFLEILEENDPVGYADGMYGTRESWREWWLQADQGHVPEIEDRSLTVWGYLDVALEQLTAAQESLATDNGSGRPAAGPRPDAPATAPDHDDDDEADAEFTADAEIDRIRRETMERVAAAHAERDAQVAAARAERDRAIDEGRAATDRAAARIRAVEAEAEERVRAAEAGAAERISAAEAAAAEAHRLLADATAERDEALDEVRATRRRRRKGAMLVVVVVVAAVGWSIGIGVLSRHATTQTVLLAAPAQQVTAAEQVTFSFVPPLPAGRDWTLHVRLNVRPADPMSACTFGLRITAHLQVDGRPWPAFTSAPGQTTITRAVHLGERGHRGLQLMVTRVDTDPVCRVRLDPLGSQAIATG